MSDPYRDRLADNFGARHVSAPERRALIRQVFVEVAPRYDIMNDLMSFGIHRLWKDRFAAAAGARAGEIVVDLASGTGDIARRLAATGATVVAVDPGIAMLRAGRRRETPFLQVAAEGETLPFPDNSIDCLTIAFGIRNVTQMNAALAEIHRVLRPGGRFLCLEFSRAQAWLRPFYALWSVAAIPLLGAVIAQSRAAYRYLVESIRRFPDQREFASIIAAAGFEDVAHRNLSFGIAAIHSARKRRT
ncbi:MAG: class I SAM-dependent methyltransferase [Xanthobacteraceae bacterium]|nr:MAG: class I SAM-dependent methyltransferase [Xanthobacteraceae bacterium]